MKIYFKEVGQGDSIIIECSVDGKKKLAIIDCNIKKDGTNPILNHLISNSVESIYFILLTHPHFDHYSGMGQVLDYCESKSIKIEYFLHTSDKIPECLKAAVKGHVARSVLDKLFKKLETLLDSGIINDVFVVTNNSRELPLQEDWRMKFLAPTHLEFRSFIKKKYKATLEPKVNSSIANLLSTFIKIHDEKNHVLLTSDLELHIFQRMESQNFPDLNSKLLMCQIPHHGSRENFHNKFWKHEAHKTKISSVISVGENDYDHPSKYVYAKLNQFGYDVEFTNQPYFLTSSKKNKVSEALDSISIVISKNKAISSRDIVFDLNQLRK